MLLLPPLSPSSLLLLYPPSSLFLIPRGRGLWQDGNRRSRHISGRPKPPAVCPLGPYHHPRGAALRSSLVRGDPLFYLHACCVCGLLVYIFRIPLFIVNSACTSPVSLFLAVSRNNFRRSLASTAPPKSSHTSMPSASAFSLLPSCVLLPSSSSSSSSARFPRMKIEMLRGSDAPSKVKEVKAGLKDGSIQVRLEGGREGERKGSEHLRREMWRRPLPAYQAA